MTKIHDNGISSKEVSVHNEAGELISPATTTLQASILAAITALAATVGFILAYLQSIDVVDYEGESSIRVSQSYQPTFTVNLSTDGLSGTTGLMLIDLSDLINWPHDNSTHIVLKYLDISSNTDAAFIGDLMLGFLSNVDASNGDFNELLTLHGERNSTLASGSLDFSSFGLGLEVDEWFGNTLEDNETWQTDVNLLGPDGQTAYPAGNGDFVALLDSTAGSIDVSILVIYTTPGE